MNILFIAPRFHSNQISLIKKLKEEGHNVHFFVMGIGNSEDHTLVEPKIIPISFISKLFYKILYKNKKIDIFKYSVISIPSFRQYFKMVSEVKPDSVILRQGNYIYFFMIIPFLIIKGINYTFYSQTPKFSQPKRTGKVLKEKLITLNYKTKWFSPVLYRGEFHSDLIDNKHIDYLPFFMYPNLFSSPKDENKNDISFLCVSKYEARKNIELLIDAASELREISNNFKITVIGSTGNDSREKFYDLLRQKIKANDLEQQITLLKNVPYSEMGNYYIKNDVFILPTTNEPASISQLEAMSYGMAVICSEDNGTAHYIQDKVNGFIISPTKDKIVEKMLMYATDIKTLQMHKANSLEIINTEFSIDKAYAKFIEITGK